MSTLCPECSGLGEVPRYRAAQHRDGRPLHRCEFRLCRVCWGQEWLPGLRPPT